MDLSIIVPVYNVEKYVRACIESIYRQGLDESRFEVIIVNDGTEDRSMEVIADIIGNHDNVTVINQENQGLSAARNNGIAVAKGEYILMPDSDDLLIENSVPSLLKLAFDTKADIVVANFLEMDNDEIANYKHHPQENISTRELTGEQLFIEELNPRECYVWRSLFRKDFITQNNIISYPGIKYQDIPFTHECYLKSKRCIRSSLLLNIYRRRSGSTTASFELSKADDFGFAIALTWKLRYTEGLSPQQLKKLENDVYISLTMLVYLISHAEGSFAEKRKAIRYLKEVAPDISFQDGIKQRVYSFLYQKHPMTLVYLRFLYGMIIEDGIRPVLRRIIGKMNRR